MLRRLTSRLLPRLSSSEASKASRSVPGERAHPEADAPLGDVHGLVDEVRQVEDRRGVLEERQLPCLGGHHGAGGAKTGAPEGRSVTSAERWPSTGAELLKPVTYAVNVQVLPSG